MRDDTWRMESGIDDCESMMKGDVRIGLLGEYKCDIGMRGICIRDLSSVKVI